MRFSIVVPFRNAERFLDGCIRSLLGQAYPDDRYEILLVDNASSDRSVELARQHPAVRLLHQPQIGAYAARNLGLDHAQGEIIAFIDADCEADPGWLRALERALRDPETGVVLGRRQFPVAAGPLTWLQAFEHHKADWVFALPEATRYYGYTNNMAVRASMFDRLGRFAEVRRGADTVWVQAAARRLSPRTVRFTPDALVHHMEITSLAQYYQKMWLYGRSSRRNRSRTYQRLLAPRAPAGLSPDRGRRALRLGGGVDPPAPPDRRRPLLRPRRPLAARRRPQALLTPAPPPPHCPPAPPAPPGAPSASPPSRRPPPARLCQ